MPDGLSLDVLLAALADALAERVAARLDTRTGDGAAAVKPRLLTIEQAAVYLGRTKEAIQHLIAERRIQVVRSDRRVFVDVRDLERWIEENKT